MWTYTLDNDQRDGQALNDASSTLTDTFTVADRGRHLADGDDHHHTAATTRRSSPATTTGAVTEAGAPAPGTPTATGDLDATDVDNAADALRRWCAGAATTAATAPTR